MTPEELAPHIEELKKVLKHKVDEGKIASELEEYVNVHLLDIDTAKRSILRKYGGVSSEYVTGNNVSKKIDELTGTEQNVDLTAKVLFSARKTIKGRNGDREIVSGILGDETGTVSFTDWSGDNEIVKGKVYVFKNCYTKKWNDNVQINFGNNFSLEESDKDIQVKDRENKDFTPAEAVSKKIDELDGTEKNVDILAKVVFAEVKDITNRDGTQKKINSGILGDETGTASFTMWNETPVLEKGKTYRFKNCYTKKWNDTVQINIGNMGSVEVSDVEIETVPQKQRSFSSSEMKIGDIRENSGNVTVVGRVLSVEQREITTKNGDRKTVFSGTIADDTGEIQYSAWNDFGLAADKSYRISNAYIRSWKGIPQINLGDNTEIAETDVKFDDTKRSQGNERTIGDIAKNGGGMDVVIRGVVVDIRPGSGIIKRCPQCNRTIINNECVTHGSVEPVPDLRMRIVVDDGSGSISTTMNREFTEKFTGVSFDAAFNLSKARGEDIVVKELGDKLYMKHLKIRGNAMIDEYGLKINAKDITADDVDVKGEAKKLLEEVEARL